MGRLILCVQGGAEVKRALQTWYMRWSYIVFTSKGFVSKKFWVLGAKGSVQNFGRLFKRSCSKFLWIYGLRFLDMEIEIHICRYRNWYYVNILTYLLSILLMLFARQKQIWGDVSWWNRFRPQPKSNTESQKIFQCSFNFDYRVLTHLAGQWATIPTRSRMLSAPFCSSVCTCGWAYAKHPC